MKCPVCRKEVPPGGAHEPFCSDRCRLIDLGNWAAGKYRIPAEEEEQEDEDKDREA
jgi:endogenous inhibitor of DNA gyrase (YacG/DUF329 family)